MKRRLKQGIKRRLARLACRHLGLYPDPPALVSDLGHPLGLIRNLGLECRGVIHVGANLGLEFGSYRRAGLENVVYIEPIPEIFAKLQARISVDRRHRAINALCTDRIGDEVDFHIASNGGESSSIFEFGTHAHHHPQVSYVRTLRLRTTTLDHIMFGTPSLDPRLFDCLVLDVQGAEAKVIAGAKQTLGLCRFVFAEVNEGGLYKGDATSEEIVATLKAEGFILKSLDINGYGWGNAFFVKA
jgi:FkbM family methyltransferase